MELTPFAIFVILLIVLAIARVITGVKTVPHSGSATVRRDDV